MLTCALQCDTVCCSMVYCVAVCCSVLLCVAVRCRDLKVELAMMWWSHIAMSRNSIKSMPTSTKTTFGKSRNRTASLHLLQCVAVCCSVLQCVAVYCGVLQCVVVRGSVL